MVAVELVANLARRKYVRVEAECCCQVRIASVFTCSSGASFEPAVSCHLVRVVSPQTTYDGTAISGCSLAFAKGDFAHVEAVLYIRTGVVEITCNTACGTTCIVESYCTIVGTERYAVASQVSHNACKVVSTACSHIHRAAECAATNGVAATTRAYDATYMMHASYWNHDCQRGMDVGDGTVRRITYDASTGSGCCRECSGNAEVLDGCASCKAEEAAAVSFASCVETRNAVSLSVEGTSVNAATGSDGIPWTSFCNDIGKADVCSEHSIGSQFAVAYQVGKHLELLAIVDYVVGDAVNLRCGQVVSPRLRSCHSQKECHEQ